MNLDLTYNQRDALVSLTDCNQGIRLQEKLKAMMKYGLTVFFLFICMPVFAGEPGVSATQAQSPASDQPSNLTLSNFFIEGWDQAWTKRVTPGGAPDMSLLHVQTNFLEREFRFDYYHQQNTGGNNTRNIDFVNGLIAYGVNRRLMIEVVSNYEWMNSRVGASKSGTGGALVARVQLVDVPGSSYAFNFRVSAPDEGIDQKQTTFSFAIAGWHDLASIGLNRVGLYYHIQEETYAGPAKAGSKHNDLTYAVSLAKTWNGPNVLFGNFTTFVEAYGTTNLDGTKSGHTDINATPGIRLNLGHGHALMAGLDLPVSNPHAFTETYRVTYIYNF